MNIDQGAVELKVTNKRAIKRAKKIYKKLSYCSDVMLEESARGMACLYIACKIEGESYTPGEMARYSGVPESAFLRTCTCIQCVLKIKYPPISIEFLCDTYQVRGLDPEYLRDETNSALDTLQERLPNALLGDLHTCASFHLVCLRDSPSKVKGITDKELSGVCSCELQRFRDTQKLITRVLPEMVPSPKAKSPPSKHKRSSSGPVKRMKQDSSQDSSSLSD